MKFNKLVNYVLAGTIGLQLPLLQIQSVFASSASTVAEPISNSLVTGEPKAPRAKPKPLNRKNKYGFSCIGTTTILTVQKGSRPAKKIPLIEWTEAGAEQFGDNYTAKSRCETVSSRFKKLLIVNKNKLRNVLPVTRIGTLNGMQVICISKGKGACPASTLLWTLKTQNVANSKQVLSQLVSTIKNPSVASGRTPIFESPDDGSDDQSDSQMESSDEFDTEEILAAAVNNFESSDDTEEFESSDDTEEFESSDDTELESSDDDISN